VEVVHEAHFLQVVNTTLYATTMDFSNYFLKNHNSHIHTCFSLFYRIIGSQLLILENTKHDFQKVYTCYIAYLVPLGSSTLSWWCHLIWWH
jgi:hypothetical protein